MRDFRDAKAMAQSLREALKAKKISITHGECLELVSRMLGLADWNTLSALITSDQPDHAATISAEERQAPSAATPDERARLLADQQAARNVIPFEPARFDKYVGHYQLRSTVPISVTRDGGRFYSSFPGQPQPTEFYPESETKFFATTVAAQISFGMDPRGDIVELILHQNGREQHAMRIDEAAAAGLAAALAQRIAANTASPGTEEAIRKHLQSVASGEPDFDVMEPGLAEAARQQWPATKSTRMALGALKSIKFVRVGPRGWDEYVVQFEHGAWQWTISPLGPDGKASGMYGQPAGSA